MIGSEPGGSSTKHPDASGWDVVVIAIWIGLLLGFAQVSFLAYRVLRHILTWHGRQAVWMIPAGETAAFLVVGILLVLAGRYFNRLRTWGGVVGVLVFLAVLGLLVEFDRLHPLSNFMVAGGIGAVAGRIAGRWPRHVRRVAGWTVPPLLALVVVLAIGLNLWLFARERGALSPTGPGAPNVLLIVLDTVRAAELSLYGYEHPTTPNLERFARRGVRFDRAIATAPWTLPTHATLFTGRLGSEHGADWNVPLDGTFPTVAEFLAEHGYRTGGFVANEGYGGWHTGLGRGFSRYEDYDMSLRDWTNASVLIEPLTELGFIEDRMPSDRRTASDISASFLAWQAKHPQPFFAFLNYYDAHIPYVAPEPFRTRFGAAQSAEGMGAITRWLTEYDEHPTEQDIQQAKAAYGAAIAYIDAELGALFGELERRHVLDNTLVIVTADHGEEFGEHGILDHGNSLYLPSLHVPLVLVHSARIPSGQVVESFVSLRDVPVTIAALLGLEKPPFSGSPLPVRLATGLLAEARPATIHAEVSFVPRVPEFYPVSKGDMRSIIRDSLHVIVNGDGRREIYDVVRDPWEQNDLAGEIAPLRAGS